VGEYHDPAGDPLHLAQPGDRVLPVMNRGDGHRGVEGLVSERQVLRYSGDAGRGTGRALSAHEGGWLDRDDVPAGRFAR
jgi:hypothetical protein